MINNHKINYTVCIIVCVEKINLLLIGKFYFLFIPWMCKFACEINFFHTGIVTR